VYTRNCEIKPNSEMPEGMHRIALCVEYSGAEFNGFQRQTATDNTVQEALERAFTWIAQEPITLVCAGRTDAGVHATGQIVHFDTVVDRPTKAWVRGVNTKLPDSVRVHWAKEVMPEFHARYSAHERMYRYVMHESPVCSATLGKQVTHCSHALDKDAMMQAASYLVGEHDFSSFRSSRCQASNAVRNIAAITWQQQGDLLIMEIRANAFLQHMVRNIVGSLLDVGKGKVPPSWIADVLDRRDRRLAGATAEPWGLYLVKVTYPDVFQLPAGQLGPVFLAP